METPKCTFKKWEDEDTGVVRYREMWEIKARNKLLRPYNIVAKLAHCSGIEARRHTKP